MNSTATQVLQDAIFASVCEAITAFKKNAGGMPNALARDLAAVHDNTAFADIPESVQNAIKKATQDALKRLNKEGYSVASKNPPARPVAAPVAVSRGSGGKRRSGQ